MKTTGKIKILYIITKLDQGGAQKSVLYSALHLPQNIFDVYLAAGPGGPLEASAKTKFKKHFFTISFLKQKVSFFNLFFDALATAQIFFLILRLRPDIVHTNCPKAGVVGRAAAVLFKPKIKTVHTYHGLGFSVYGGIKRYLFFAYVERLFAYITNKLVFVSAANKAEAESLSLRIGNPRKNVLIYAGAEYETLKPNFDKEQKLASLGIKPGGKIVLSIGNFKPLKNARDFVQVASDILKKMPNVHFLYVGFGGNQENKTKTLAKKLNLKKNLSFLGLRHDVRELFAISDVYVSTSLREGLPLSLLESFAYGVPAVCYEADGTSEVLQNNKNGFIIGQSRRQEMTDCVISLLSDVELYNKFKTATQNFDSKKFGAAATLSQQITLYRSLL